MAWITKNYGCLLPLSHLRVQAVHCYAAHQISWELTKQLCFPLKLCLLSCSSWHTREGDGAHHSAVARMEVEQNLRSMTVKFGGPREVGCPQVII